MSSFLGQEKQRGKLPCGLAAVGGEGAEGRLGAMGLVAAAPPCCEDHLQRGFSKNVLIIDLFNSTYQEYYHANVFNVTIIEMVYTHSVPAPGLRHPAWRSWCPRLLVQNCHTSDVQRHVTVATSRDSTAPLLFHCLQDKTEHPTLILNGLLRKPHAGKSTWLPPLWTWEDFFFLPGTLSHVLSTWEL